jgi:hypothetical protein
MKQRRLLQKQIVDAWHQCIRKDYSRQRVNSEHSLQASFWSRLNRILPETRRMFIEPGIVIAENGSTRKIIPDLVICNTREVIGVIELKYRPRGNPAYAKDVDSLAAVARCRDGITIANDRFRGQAVDETVYSLSKHILFVWAGVHAPVSANAGFGADSLYSDGYEELNGCFIELHAETSQNATPKLYER